MPSTGPTVRLLFRGRLRGRGPRGLPGAGRREIVKGRAAVRRAAAGRTTASRAAGHTASRRGGRGRGRAFACGVPDGVPGTWA